MPEINILYLISTSVLCIYLHCSDKECATLEAVPNSTLSDGGREFTTARTFTCSNHFRIRDALHTEQTVQCTNLTATPGEVGWIPSPDGIACEGNYYNYWGKVFLYSLV